MGVNAGSITLAGACVSNTYAGIPVRLLLGAWPETLSLPSI
jgi:hypothetical protein